MKNKAIALIQLIMTWLRPPRFPDEEENKIARIVSNILFALIATYFILISARSMVGDFREVRILLAGLALFSLAFILLHCHRLRASVLTLGILLLAQVTLVATVGQGVRDLAVVSYPAILIVMSLLMHRGSYLFFTLLTLGCIIWVTLGAALGLYSPLPPPTPGLSDFMVLGSITLVAAYMAYLLSENLRRSLAQAKEEIFKREALTQVVEGNLHEKELLLKEVHHRVKNNLTVIYSLLNLQKKSIQTPQQAKDALDDMRDRIRSMSLVHEQLYKTNHFSRIAMAPYVEQLAQQLRFQYAPGRGIHLALDVDDLLLGIDDAIPCGLIINEAVTNAMKHAFEPGMDDPRITITLKRHEEGGRYSLRVKDNGRGLPDHVDTEKLDSLGLKLMGVLAEQLHGELDISSEEGTRISLTFKPTPRRGEERD